jgi:HEPN domain-containing protein
VTTSDVVAHWRKGARDALRLAVISADQRVYELAIFHCHLAMEKALKAAIMEEKREPHPKSHNLDRLAFLLRDDWSEADRKLLDTLTTFAVAARYDDPAWAERFATAKNARRWIQQTEQFLTRHSLL